MATLVLRQSKGSPLTNNEVDANFTNLNADIQTRVLITDFNAHNIITQLETVDGVGSGLDADLLQGLQSNPSLPTGPNYSSVVTRDSTGSSTFYNLTSTNNITGVNATFTGSLSVGSISISGGSIPVSVGGTGATNASNARANLGLIIGTNVQAWNTKLDSLSGISGAADQVVYFNGANTLTTASLTSYARSLIATTSTSGAQAVLGTRVGTDVQPFSAELTAYANLSTTGLVARTATNTIVPRTLAAGSDITISNPDGVAGNPTINVGSNIPRLNANNTFTGSNTVNGNESVGGTVYAGGFQISSDQRLKENVQTLNNAVDTVLQLRGVSYLKQGKPEIGLIAQEVERVMPFLVGEDSEGFKSVAYANIVGLLIEAIKEQNETIKELNTRLENLEK
jgi:hypothetical protein